MQRNATPMLASTASRCPVGGPCLGSPGLPLGRLPQQATDPANCPCEGTAKDLPCFALPGHALPCLVENTGPIGDMPSLQSLPCHYPHPTTKPTPPRGDRVPGQQPLSIGGADYCNILLPCSRFVRRVVAINPGREGEHGKGRGVSRLAGGCCTDGRGAGRGNCPC